MPLKLTTTPRYTPMHSQNQTTTMMVKADYHPLLFFLLFLLSAAELGLCSYFLCIGNEDGSWSEGPYFRACLIFLTFASAWTTLFALSYTLYYFLPNAPSLPATLLANIASSIAWLFLTSTFWGVGAGLYRLTREPHEGDCTAHPALSPCRARLTVEALAWSTFSVSTLTMLVTLAWIALTRASSVRKERTRKVETPDSGKTLIGTA